MSEKRILLPVAEQPSQTRTTQSSTKRTCQQLLPAIFFLGLILIHFRFNGAIPGSYRWSQISSAGPESVTDVDEAHDSSATNTASNLCLTPDCVHAASELLYNLSPNYKQSEPCEDFEEMVCGGWRDRHDLRSDQGHVFEGILMSERSQTLLRHILEAGYPETSMVSSFERRTFPMSMLLIHHIILALSLLTSPT